MGPPQLWLGVARSLLRGGQRAGLYSAQQHFEPRAAAAGSCCRRLYSAGILGLQERTLIAVKPDGVQRRLVGDVIQRFEKRGFKLVGLKLLQVWEGHNVVKTSRAMVGETNPAEAKPGTIRGDFSIHVSRNVVHASDSVETAQREISLWFRSNELLDWECGDHKIMYEL
ncbi:nucleoside diphosphate kinase, mitochondrial isoform X2 [Hemicordylus capensis]|uniref:nucleoside diphosphate kinase, mitochondrial isoform X2 n=1 Tax=Hemicordylus capensis TaxID=884348 RepID=UPI002303C5F1|nr:nucleoside diphosphate kinase, mitochondrial isoform X2 [Hemicordylus capensis]